MSREIKFRAWDKIHKVIIQVDIIFFSRGTGLRKRVVHPFKIEGITLDMPEGKEYTLYEGEFILLEFTGLKDKNGKEIFEGDILRTDNYNGEHNFLVQFDNDIGGSIGSFHPICIDDKNISSVHSQVIDEGEVIGNIYENPELLEEAK